MSFRWWILESKCLSAHHLAYSAYCFLVVDQYEEHINVLKDGTN